MESRGWIMEALFLKYTKLYKFCFPKFPTLSFEKIIMYMARK